MENVRDYAALPHEYLEEMAALNDAEFGRLVRSLLVYSREGTPIALCGNERFYAVRVMTREDRYQESYIKTQEERSNAGKAGANARWGNKNANACDRMETHTNACDGMLDDGKNGNTKTETKTETETETKKKSKARARFIPPTLEEVRAYCRERNSPVDPEQFYEYFTADPERQWIDSKGQPVLNWKQKLVTWEKFQGGSQRKGNSEEMSEKYRMMREWANG